MITLFFFNYRLFNEIPSGICGDRQNVYVQSCSLILHVSSIIHKTLEKVLKILFRKSIPKIRYEEKKFFYCLCFKIVVVTSYIFSIFDYRIICVNWTFTISFQNTIWGKKLLLVLQLKSFVKKNFLFLLSFFFLTSCNFLYLLICWICIR